MSIKSNAVQADLSPDKLATYAILFEDEISRGTRTKINIIEATTQLLYKEGVYKLTFEKIGNACGLYKAQVRYHFPIVEEIFVFAFKLSMLTLRRTISHELRDVKSWWDQIKAHCYASFKWLDHYPEQANLIQLVFQMTNHHHQLRELLLGLCELGRASMEEYLFDSDKKLSDNEVRELAYAIQDILVGSTMTYFVATKEKSSDQCADHCLQSIRALLVKKGLLDF